MGYQRCRNLVTLRVVSRVRSPTIFIFFATFTTVAFGDIVALGPWHLLAGMEALTGFVLNTWTAYYLYIEWV